MEVLPTTQVVVADQKDTTLDEETAEVEEELQLLDGLNTLTQAVAVDLGIHGQVEEKVEMG